MPKPRSKRKNPSAIEQMLGVRGLTAGSALANDMFANSAARTGFGTPSLGQGGSHELIRFSYNYWEIITLYRNHWLSRRIVDAPAQDMVKAWPRLTSDIAPKDLSRIDRALRKTNTKNNILTGLTWGRLFGGAGGLMIIEGQENELDQPLDLESVPLGGFKGIVPFDRWAGVSPMGDVCTDINRPLDFNKPEMYECRASGGDSFRVHSSRLLRFLGPTVPTPEVEAQSWWGISVLEPIYESTTRLDNMYANLLNLSFRANLIGMKFPELAQLLSGLGSSQMASQKFEQRMSAINHLMSNQSLIPLPTDGSIEQTQYSFSGMADVLQLFQLDIAGAAQIPITRLFGRTYNGLGQAGDGDERIYEERITTDQSVYLAPQLEKLYPVICMSELGDVPDDLDLTFPSIRVLDEKEKAELAKAVADTTTVYLNGGIMSARVVAKEVKQSSDITGLGTNLTDEDIARLPDTPQSEGEMGEGLFGEAGGGLNEADSPAKAIKSENKVGKEEESGAPAEPENKAGKEEDPEEELSAKAPAMDALPAGLRLGECVLVDGRLLTVEKVIGGVKDMFGDPVVQVHFASGEVHAYRPERKRAGDAKPPIRLSDDELEEELGVLRSMRMAAMTASEQRRFNALADEAVRRRKASSTWDARHGTRPLRRATDEDGASSITTRAQGMADWHALPVRIETPEGGVRTGITPSGESWRTMMPADYGFIDLGIDGADGDSLDCYVGPSPESNNVFVVDQLTLDGKKFDEHKIMLGFITKESALEDYMLGHHLSKRTFAAITEMTIPRFRKWMAAHDMTKPCDPKVKI
jgi:phage-related protein (TIGR01555 family)